MLNNLIRFLQSLYLTDRFFWLGGALVVLLVSGFWLPAFFRLGQAAVVLALALCIWEALRLYARPLRLRVRRRLPRVLSLGDETSITLDIHNRSAQTLHLTIIDELPIQLQERQFELRLRLPGQQERHPTYSIRPLERGVFAFGAINIYVATPLGLIERRIRRQATAELAVYPSIVQMRRYAFRAFERASSMHGLKQVRRLGHSYEFDQIKSYVRGDDYRSLNWKATGRRGELMVNQYEDERAQQIYCAIDKGRAMRMPFNGLSLVDHAINATLALLNIVLKKHDRAGLITFSDQIGALLPADSQSRQLRRILQALYKEDDRPLEPDYEKFYYASRQIIKGRSLILLFTNFESQYALERVLPILRRISTLHLLVVIFFENTEIREMTRGRAATVEAAYQQTIARQFLANKSAMVQKLRLHGIQSVLTRPEELTVNAINKYLELKARGLI